MLVLRELAVFTGCGQKVFFVIYSAITRMKQLVEVKLLRVKAYYFIGIYN